MAITIKEIHEKEFSHDKRGYNEVEVDDFLDLIANEIALMQKEINSLRENLAARPADASPSSTAVIPMLNENSESALNILQSAQRIYDETVASANEQSENILSNAQKEAENIITEANTESQRLATEITTLKNAAADYRARFLRLIEDQKLVLQNDATLFNK